MAIVVPFISFVSPLCHVNSWNWVIFGIFILFLLALFPFSFRAILLLINFTSKHMIPFIFWSLFFFPLCSSYPDHYILIVR